MARLTSAALPIAYVLLRILIILNWIFGACIFALLIYTFINEAWTMKALGVSEMPDAETVMTGMRAVAALGVLSIFLNYALLKRLVRMIGTVRAGEPFVAENAYRLQAIGWLLLGLQVLGMAIGAIGEALSTPKHPFHLDAGFSVNGWLAVR